MNRKLNERNPVGTFNTITSRAVVKETYVSVKKKNLPAAAKVQKTVLHCNVYS